MQNKIIRIRSGIYVANSYYIFDNDGHALIIDPACSFNKSEEILHGYTPTLLLLTHGHLDHSYDCDLFIKRYNAKLYIHEKEVNYLTDSRYNSPNGLPSGYNNKLLKCDDVFKNGDTIRFGEYAFSVIHTPGHTEGSCCFYSNGFLFSGDTLFKGSIGRTDFPFGCDESKMQKSLQQLINIIPEDTVIYPGHGFQTNMKEEKLNNPYLQYLL